MAESSGAGLEPAWSVLGIAAPADQAGALEHLEVLRDRLQCHLERLGELVDRCLAVGQAGEDRSTGRVGKCGKRVAEWVDFHGLRVS